MCNFEYPRQSIMLIYITKWNSQASDSCSGKSRVGACSSVGRYVPKLEHIIPDKDPTNLCSLHAKLRNSKYQF